MSDQGRQDELDRLIDQAVDTGGEPVGAAHLQEELRLQLAIDGALQRLFAPGLIEAIDPAAARVDQAVDHAIDSGAAVQAGARDDGELALQGRIDSALRRHFGALELRPRSRLSWRAGLAIAAVLTIASAAVLVTTGSMGGGWLTSGGNPVVNLYKEHTTVDVVAAPCETPEQFQEWVELHFKQAVRPVLEGDEGLTFVGWNYDNLLSDQTGVMVGEARGAEVILILDRVAADRGLSVPEGGSLHLFRRQIGDLVFYEVTPLEKAEFIDTLELLEG